MTAPDIRERLLDVISFTECANQGTTPDKLLDEYRDSILATGRRSAADDEWVRCSGLHCPNGERHAKAEERGWLAGHMDTWLCPTCRPTRTEA